MTVYDTVCSQRSCSILYSQLFPHSSSLQQYTVPECQSDHLSVGFSQSAIFHNYFRLRWSLKLNKHAG